MNPWQRSSQVVASIDYAKQDEVRERIWQQRWDLVIIDEAHKCSAYTKSSANRGDEAEKTKRYQTAYDLDAMIVDGANKQAVVEMQRRHDLPFLRKGRGRFIPRVMNSSLILVADRALYAGLPTAPRTRGGRCPRTTRPDRYPSPLPIPA